MYNRILELDTFLRHRSLFLLGPRQTGKSTLLRTSFPAALYIDLLANDVFRRLAAAPERLRDDVNGYNLVRHQTSGHYALSATNCRCAED